MHTCRLAFLLAFFVSLACPAAAGPRDDGAAACPGETFTLRHAAGGAAPYVRLSADGKAGNFLLDWGSTGSSLSAEAFPAPPNTFKIVRLTLPTFPSGSFALRHHPAISTPRGGRLGIIGTDFLSKMSAHLSYGLLRDAVRLGPGPCDATALQSLGFVPIPQVAFSATGGNGIGPNVPVLPVSIAGIAVPAQIDSGYDDTLLKHSIDINEAFQRKLLAAGIKLARASDIEVATCSGRERRQVLTAPGFAMIIGTDPTKPIRTIKRFSLLVKPRNGCGGIADMNEPAAQLGASFLKSLSPLVIDGKSATVWLRP